SPAPLANHHSSLHDALPSSGSHTDANARGHTDPGAHTDARATATRSGTVLNMLRPPLADGLGADPLDGGGFRLPEDHVLVGDDRSEEHTSELQSPDHLVCRL